MANDDSGTSGSDSDRLQSTSSVGTGTGIITDTGDTDTGEMGWGSEPTDAGTSMGMSHTGPAIGGDTGTDNDTGPLGHMGGNSGSPGIVNDGGTLHMGTGPDAVGAGTPSGPGTRGGGTRGDIAGIGGTGVGGTGTGGGGGIGATSGGTGDIGGLGGSSAGGYGESRGGGSTRDIGGIGGGIGTHDVGDVGGGASSATDIDTDAAGSD